MLKSRVGYGVRNYWEVTKPKIWYLLVFTAFASAVIASRISGVDIDVPTWILLLASVTAGSAGANTVSSYIDRDIDAIMERTKHRPIPSKRIDARHALYYGLALIAIALVTSAMINAYALMLMAFGIFDYVIVYSKLLKRRSRSNIVLGGFSGGMPALIGYVAVTTANIEVGVMLAMLVFLWIPMHIWSLALRLREDYRRANVPMLPVVNSVSTSTRVIAATTLLMVAFSIALAYTGYFEYVYIAVAGVMGAIVTVMSIQLLIRPDENKAWRLFKFSSPYLAVLFIAMMVDLLI
ncbi:MAG: heme o synthase [Candidatus Nitrosocaldus sp.]|nr:heme o synthase [Candidatus Nitrosocaldus sp.]MCS7140806.1 heme o synthase [Candidatus Nitrosocaldus sp.]MDW7999734.1 heme o synthase [Candidatus Nitrosocaldus sp.]MDW8274906.1 heme o synthase [Candidatus Nitrosocaldus sp.]